MKRMILTGLLALTLSLGFAAQADAQIVYGYSVPRGGGVASGGTVLVPGGVKTFNNFYSPFTGVMTGQTYGQNFMGQAFGRSYGYNPWTGMSFQSGFYQPNYWFNPLGGVNYTVVRRWGW